MFPSSSSVDLSTSHGAAASKTTKVTSNSVIDSTPTASDYISLLGELFVDTNESQHPSLTTNMNKNASSSTANMNVLVPSPLIQFRFLPSPVQFRPELPPPQSSSSSKLASQMIACSHSPSIFAYEYLQSEDMNVNTTFMRTDAVNHESSPTVKKDNHHHHQTNNIDFGSSAYHDEFDDIAVDIISSNDDDGVMLGDNILDILPEPNDQSQPRMNSIKYGSVHCGERTSSMEQQMPRLPNHIFSRECRVATAAASNIGTGYTMEETKSGEQEHSAMAKTPSDDSHVHYVRRSTRQLTSPIGFTLKDENENENKECERVRKTEMNSCDIMSGRGLASSLRPGNVLFRKLVHENTSRYHRCKYEAERAALAEEIHTALKPGRFIKFSGKDIGRVLDHNAATKKIQFAMRDHIMSRNYKKRKTKIGLKATIAGGKKKARTSEENKSNPSSNSVTRASVLKNASTLGKVALKSQNSTKRANQIVVANKEMIGVKNPKPNVQGTKKNGEKKATSSNKSIPIHLTKNEIRTIKCRIGHTVNPSDNALKSFQTNTDARSEMIHSSIEKLVAKGAEMRQSSKHSFDSNDWFHPEMQKCIRLQILERCTIAMKTTGMNHVEFFESLSKLNFFP